MSYSNGLWSSRLYTAEQQLLDKIWLSLSGHSMFVGHGVFRPIGSNDPPPLMLSHYTHAKHSSIEPRSHWTAVAWIRPKDFAEAHGVSGAGRIYRASMLVHPDIDLLDDLVQRVETPVVGVEEFIIQEPIGGSNLAWLRSGWI